MTRQFNYVTDNSGVVLYAKDDGFRLTIERNRNQYLVISWYFAYHKKDWFKGAVVYRRTSEEVENTCNYILQNRGDNYDN